MRISLIYILLFFISISNVHSQVIKSYTLIRDHSSNLDIAFASGIQGEDKSKDDSNAEKDILKKDDFFKDEDKKIFSHSLNNKSDQKSSWISYMYNTYGQIKLSSESSFPNTYLYQGQEYNNDLNISIFPSRIYSSTEKRFLQPDPASQYFSPYLFVNADPVNYVDRNGQEGHRPLVLFQEDHNYPLGMNPGTRDLMAVIPDAHFVPISDFINERVVDLPDWNGNVFFRGHIGINAKGRELIAEAGGDLNKLKTEMRTGVHAPQFIQDYGTNVVTMDAEEMGRKLRRFSHERKVPIKRVTEGGCFGSYATEPMHRGFMEESKKYGKLKQKIKFRGSKSGWEGRLTGDNVFRDMKYVNYPKATRFYLTPYGKPQGLPFKTRNFERQFEGFTHSLDGGKTYIPDVYIEGEDVKNMTNGIFSRKIKSIFKKITDIY